LGKPDMILFDFGGTILLDDPEPDFVNGTKKVMELADDTNGATPEEVQKFADILVDISFEDRKNRIIQVTEQSFNRFLYGYFGIKFSRMPFELERTFWDNAFHFKPAPGIDELFAFLDRLGIRKAILSNNAFEESTLRYELDKHFSDKEFEFVISTADYCFRKPSPMIFNLALKIAGLEKENVWYAGNSQTCDVAGAYNAGILPAWYNPVNEVLVDEYKHIEHLEISCWHQLIEIMEEMEAVIPKVIL
jgi:putative hydrolase of the HAD superfamily